MGRRDEDGKADGAKARGNRRDAGRFVEASTDTGTQTAMGGGYRKSDSSLYPGKVGRKTGFQVTWTPTRGANGLEDPKEFFLSDDEFESQETTTTSPVKRLSMRFSKLQELQAGSPTKDSRTSQAGGMLEEVREAEEQEAGEAEKPEADRLEADRPDAGSASSVNANGSASIDGGSDTDSDMDLEEAIKRAEDIGTPIRIPRRTLTSITGSPASNSSTVLSNKPLLTHTANGSKLTKNMALNKNTRSSKFEPQDITNADPEPAETGVGVLNVVMEEDERAPLDDAVAEKESQVSPANPPGRLSDVAPFSEPLDGKLEADAKAVDPVSEEPSEKLVSYSNNDELRAALEKESSPLLTQVISQPATSPKKNDRAVADQAEDVENGHTGDADKTSEDIQDQALLEQENNEAKPRSRAKPKLQAKNEKPVTTTDIVEFIRSKDDQNNSMQDRKANNLLKRKAAVKSYSTSELIDSASENESTDDELSAHDSKATIARKSKSMDTVSRTPAKATRTDSKVSKMLVPAKPKAASRQNSKAKSAQPATPIRRSTRTRVAPVASWKNEKILYKTEKVNGVIVKSVDNVLHRPDTNNAHATPQSRQRKTKSAKEESPKRAPATKKKALKSSSFANDKEIETVKSIEEPKKKRGRKRKASGKPSEPKSVPKPRTESGGHPEVRNGIKAHEKKAADLKPAKRTLKRKSEVTENNSSISRSRLKKPKTSTSNEENPVDNGNTSLDLPPTGWQGTGDGSLALSIFEGPGTEKQVERTVAYAPGSYKNVTIIKSEDEYFKVGTLFDQDCEFCGGGIIELPSGAKKAVKSNHDTYFIFYVISGEVEVTLSRNNFTVTEGCSFEIPMGNYYQFVNTGGAMAKMMFVQAKYIVIGENSSSDSDENDNRSDNNDNGDGSSETA